MSGSGKVTFERTQVRSEMSERVEAFLAQAKSCLVRGPDGSGKSHAVRDAVNGAVWVDLAPRPFTVPRFSTALALQLGEEVGRSVLEAGADGDTLGSLERASRALADRVLVVDAAEHIARSSTSPFEDPTETMFVSEANDLMSWIRARFDAEPTVVVTSRRLSEFDVVANREYSICFVVKSFANAGGGQGRVQLGSGAVLNGPPSSPGGGGTIYVDQTFSFGNSWSSSSICAGPFQVAGSDNLLKFAHIQGEPDYLVDRVKLVQQ